MGVVDPLELQPLADPDDPTTGARALAGAFASDSLASMRAGMITPP
jgi:hypothetical protein